MAYNPPGTAPAFPYRPLQETGLSKREYFASQALIGLLSSGKYVFGKEEAAGDAVRIADKMMEYLYG